MVNGELVGCPCGTLPRKTLAVVGFLPSIDRVVDCERMLGMCEQNERLVPERTVRQRSKVSDRGDERHVDVAGARQTDQLLRARLREVGLDVRMTAVKALQQCGDVDKAEALLGAYPK
jgi:hypothetical protein